MLQSKMFLQEQETEWQPAGEGAERKVLSYDATLMLVKVRFRSHSVCEPHNHPHAQVTYVESGIFEMTIGETKKTIKQGDSCYIPPFIDHWYTCISEGVLLDSFSPCRWDFLPEEQRKAFENVNTRK